MEAICSPKDMNDFRECAWVAGRGGAGPADALPFGLSAALAAPVERPLGAIGGLMLRRGPGALDPPLRSRGGMMGERAGSLEGLVALSTPMYMEIFTQKMLRKTYKYVYPAYPGLRRSQLCTSNLVWEVGLLIDIVDIWISAASFEN